MLFMGNIFTENEEITVTVEDGIRVDPDICIVELKFFKKKRMRLLAGGMNKKEALDLIREIENIKQLDSYVPNKVRASGFIDLATPEEIEEFFDLVFIEVKGGIAYRKLMKIMEGGKLFGTMKERTLEKLPDYEQQLIDQLIDASKQKAEILAAEKGKKLTKMLGYQEVNRFEKPQEEESNVRIEEKKGEPTGFSILKEKFIEDHYKGYLIDRDGRIIIHKKIEVKWGME